MIIIMIMLYVVVQCNAGMTIDLKQCLFVGGEHALLFLAVCFSNSRVFKVAFETCLDTFLLL